MSGWHSQAYWLWSSHSCHCHLSCRSLLCTFQQTPNAKIQGKSKRLCVVWGSGKDMTTEYKGLEVIASMLQVLFIHQTMSFVDKCDKHKLVSVLVVVCWRLKKKVRSYTAAPTSLSSIIIIIIFLSPVWVFITQKGTIFTHHPASNSTDEYHESWVLTTQFHWETTMESWVFVTQWFQMTENWEWRVFTTTTQFHWESA